MTDYLIAAGLIFAVNLLPAFGPPTWALLVFFRLNSDLDPVPLVIFGALAAASGRFVLATLCRRLRPRLSSKRLASLNAAQGALTGSRTKTIAALGLFALSPIPSAQLFVGAGLLTVPLLPLTAAFFAGRLVSYSIYVGAASLAKASLGKIFIDSLTSPLGIALQIGMLVALLLLVRVDWVKFLARRRPHAGG